MTDVNPLSPTNGKNKMNEKDEIEKLQKTTTDMRLDFLKILNKIEGKQASFSLYKRKNLASGIFSGSDRDVLHFAVSEFESPTGLMNSAIIRTTDIDCMTIPIKLDKASEISSDSDAKRDDNQS